MYVSHLSCPKCNKTYESEALIKLCERGAPLLVEYNLEKAKAFFNKEIQVPRGRFILLPPRVHAVVWS